MVSHGASINAVFSAFPEDEIGAGRTLLKNACISVIELNDFDMKIELYNVTAKEFELNLSTSEEKNQEQR